MGELWKDIVGWEGLYQVSNQGNVKNLRRNVKCRHGFRTIPEHYLKQNLSNKGYLIVELNRNSKGVRKSVHRLICQAFISNPTNKLTVNHVNGIKTDNRIENLAWATHKEQINHADNTGLRNVRCENSPNTKLTDRDVQILRYMVFKLGFTQKTAASFFEIGTSTTNRIIQGLTWKHLPVDYGVVVRNG